jgi:ABC-type dipeptide/oligopeptide/nickel transport system permease component
VKRKQQSRSYLERFLSLLQTTAAGVRNHEYHWRDAVRCVLLLLLAGLKGLAALILFAPAYIIAYSMKSTFESGGYLFMIVLGVISNGLLINSAYKFYTFLVHESRKGYVETAVVKGLNNSYSWNTEGGITVRSLLKWNKSFPGHVFHHIYENARFQYIPTIKQHASFLITGLIIIEMALNIQGHLCYELLQDILNKRHDAVLVIVFVIVMVVKATEILVDYWFYAESRKYENES